MNPNELNKNEIPNKNVDLFPKKLILIIVGLILIIVVLLILIISNGGHKKKNHAMAMSTIAPAVVNISSTGFTPSTITIKVNQPIIWNNIDTAKHEVATDPYPTDNGVAGFKSNTLGTSDSYSFIISKKGKYTYHDDLNPYKFMGVIIVK